MECTSVDNMDVRCVMMENIHELLAEMCSNYYDFTRFAWDNKLLDRMDKLEQRVEKLCEVCNA
jgi:hypothetical protein